MPADLSVRTTGAGANRAELRLSADDPLFTDAVLADLNRISATRAGRALLRRLLAQGSQILVEKPEPPTDPPNAWTRLSDPHDQPGRIVIAYDPADWRNPAGFGGLPSDAVLFGRLLDALAAGAVIAPATEGASAPEMESYLRERAAIPGLSSTRP